MHKNLQRTERKALRRCEVGTDGTTITSFDYDAGTVTKDANGFATIDFTITGSFVTKPDVKAFCEGSWISRDVTCSEPKTDGSVTGSVKVKPTTAYVDDDTNGKITLYVPYYGNTGIGQVTLTAKGSASLGVTSKEGYDTKVTIKVGTDESPANGGHLTVKAKDNEGNSITWLHIGGQATKSGSEITQELKLDEYILAAEGALNVPPRECTIAIYSPSGREVGRQRIVQNPIVNLALEESANCYIISAPGRYMLPACKGNKSDLKLWDGITSLSLDEVANDSDNTIAFQRMIKYGGQDYVVFDVNKTGDTNNSPSYTSIKDGNAIIALNSGSATLWSWHLWFCNNDKDRPDSEKNLERYPDNDGKYVGIQMMNRALGATVSEGVDLTAFGGANYGLWTDGLYYQWGRKDPLTIGGTTSPGTGASTDNAVINPTTYYTDWEVASAGIGWTDEKSVNDPCPPGYKVPSNEMWREENTDAHYKVEALGIELKITDESRYAYNLTRDIGDTYPSMFILYPYNGYYNSEGKHVGTRSTTANANAEGVIIKHNIPTKGQTSRLVKLEPMIFENIVFEYTETVAAGALWSNDKSFLEYGYAVTKNSSGGGLLDLFSTYKFTATRTVGNPGCTESGSGIRKKYTYDGTVEWGEPETISSEDLGVFDYQVKKAVSDAIEDYLSNATEMDAYSYNHYNTGIGIGVANQVRCVKE